MRKLRKKRLDNKISEQDFKYLPMFFESMISFLSYKVNRDETLEGIKEVKNYDFTPIYYFFRKYQYPTN